MDVWVGFDGSPGATRALEWASELAAGSEASIRPVHGWETPLLYSIAGAPYPDPITIRRRARKSLQSSLHEAIARLDIAGDVRPLEMFVGRPRHILTEAAGTEDLLVVGSRGLGSTSRLALGSVASGVASHTKGAVAIVPRSWAKLGDQDHKPTAIVAVDEADHTPTAVRWAADHLTGHRLRLLHVWVSPYGESFVLDVLGDGDCGAVSRGRQLLDRVTRAARFTLGPDVEIESELVEGSPVAAIAKKASEADVVLLGAQRHHGLARLVLGSVVQGVIHDLQVPTIIVAETVTDMGLTKAPSVGVPPRR